jgi:hypothetical protein
MSNAAIGSIVPKKLIFGKNGSIVPKIVIINKNGSILPKHKLQRIVNLRMINLILLQSIKNT